MGWNDHIEKTTNIIFTIPREKVKKGKVPIDNRLKQILNSKKNFPTIRTLIEFTQYALIRNSIKKILAIE
jgi:predicted nucleotidyltransferase